MTLESMNSIDYSKLDIVKWELCAESKLHVWVLFVPDE